MQPSYPFAASARADELDVDGTVEDDIGKSREGSRTDDEVVQRFVQEIYNFTFKIYYILPSQVA